MSEDYMIQVYLRNLTISELLYALHGNDDGALRLRHEIKLITEEGRTILYREYRRDNSRPILSLVRSA